MKLFSQVMGDGPALVIMHGVFGMSDNWQSLGRMWSKHYQVHLLDMRNHGRSPHSDQFSYEIMSDDLLEYMDDHQLLQATILGHSMGGKVAMLFSVLNPTRVAKLIVADIAPKAYAPHHHQILSALKNLPLAQLKSRSEALQQFEIKDEGTKQFLLKSLYWPEKGVLDWRFNLAVISNEIEKVGEALPPQAIFNQATLFIRGGASNYILDEDLDLIEDHFPQAELDTIPQVGHWLHAENPKEFYAKVNAFLEH